LAANGAVTTITTAGASGGESGTHTYTSNGTTDFWAQTGDYAAGNGFSSQGHGIWGESITESLQSSWQEGYTFTSLPGQATITTGGASGSSHNSGDYSSNQSGSGMSEWDTSNGGYASASGLTWASGFARQDHYDDPSSWSEPYNPGGGSPGASSSGTAVDHVWGGVTSSWSSGSWWTSQGYASGSGSGAGGGSSSGSSIFTSGTGSSSYDLYVGYPGFYQGGFAGPVPALDAGWSWGEGWVGAGENGPLGASAYSGLGYVFAPGNPVSFAAINDQSVAEGQAISLQVSASDWSVSGSGSGSSSGSGNGGYYSETGLPSGLNIDPATGLITGVIAAGAFTSGPLYDSTVTYTDAAGHSASQSFAWFIANPVTLPNPGSQSGTEGVAPSLSLGASDANAGASFTWTETNLPAGLSIVGNGNVTGTPNAGDYTVTVTATDGSGASASQTFDWSIAPAVTIQAPDGENNTEGDGVSLQLSATDATGATPTFSATDLPPGLSISSAGQITGAISAGAAAAGPYVATINVTDGTYSASQDVRWDVAPAIAISDPGSQSNSEGDVVSQQISATDSSGATPTFSATDLPTGLSISSSGKITGTVASGAAGSYNVTVTAADGIYSSSQTLTWSVADSVVSMADPGSQTSAEGTTVSLSIGATDANNLPLDYSANGLPAGLSINNNGVITGTIAAGTADVYVVRVTAYDADFASASQTFTWSVAPAVTVADPGGQSNTEGDPVSLQLTATDANGTATFTAAGLPTGLSISSGGAITGTIAAGAAAAGPYDISVTASDGTYSASQTFTWSVAPAVTITDPGPQSDTEGETASLSITVTDATGATPTFSAAALPPGLTMSRGGQITGKISAGAAAKGPYDVTITATDVTYSAIQKVRWDVVPAPDGTWTGNTAALDAFFAELGQNGRMSFDDLVDQAAQDNSTPGDLVGQPGPGNESSAVPVDFGHPGLGLLASKIRRATPPAVTPAGINWEQLLNDPNLDTTNPLVQWWEKHAKGYGAINADYFRRLATSGALPGFVKVDGKIRLLDANKAKELLQDEAKALADQQPILDAQQKVDLYAETWEEIQNRTADIVAQAKKLKDAHQAIIEHETDIGPVHASDDWTAELDYLTSQSAKLDQMVDDAMKTAADVYVNPDAEGLAKLKALSARIGSSFLILQQYSAVVAAVAYSGQALAGSGNGTMRYATWRNYLRPLHDQLQALRGLLDKLQTNGADIDDALKKTSQLLEKFGKRVEVQITDHEFMGKVLAIAMIVDGALSLAAFGDGLFALMKSSGGGGGFLAFAGGPSAGFAISLESGAVYSVVADAAAVAAAGGSAAYIMQMSKTGLDKLPSLSENGNLGDTTKNARALRKSMKEAGKTVADGEEPHHIVPSTSRFAERAREILAKFKIGINSADNGVSLSYNLHHRAGLMTKAAIKIVTDMLEKATTRGQAIQILERIADLEKAGKLLP
jgi:Putative Ig domain